MLGAIIGDFVGSRFEFHPTKFKQFQMIHDECSWTDDTVLTIAIADAFANSYDVTTTLKRYTLEYVTSYGLHYWDWANDRLGDGPYGSWSNGAAMRVSAAAYFARDVFECMKLAKISAEASHNHPEAIRGAQAVALAIFAARSGWKLNRIRDFVAQTSGYDLHQSVASIRIDAEFEVKSWISVPRAIICALEAKSFEDAIRNAVSVGGDADTEAAIAAAIVEPIFKTSEDLTSAVKSALPPELLQTLKTVQTASSKIEFVKLTEAQVSRLPVWDPSCIEHWTPPHAKPRPIIVYEPDPVDEYQAPPKREKSIIKSLLRRFLR
jgi:ADP-ribosylglycohydrolase